MRTKEGHSRFSDWWPLSALVLAVFSPLLVFLAPEQIAYHELRAWMQSYGWAISLFSIALIGVYMFWHSFVQWDELNEKQKPKLTITFPERGCIDRDLYGLPFRVRVANASAARLKHVRLSLLSIAHADWEFVPYEVREIRLPLPLPVTVDTYKRNYAPTFELGLNPGESALYDLLLVISEGSAVWKILLAPLSPNPDIKRQQWVSVNQFDARLAVHTVPRKLFTFGIAASSDCGFPTPATFATILFPGPQEHGLVDWSLNPLATNFTSA